MPAFIRGENVPFIGLFHQMRGLKIPNTFLLSLVRTFHQIDQEVQGRWDVHRALTAIELAEAMAGKISSILGKIRIDLGRTVACNPRTKKNK